VSIAETIFGVTDGNRNTFKIITAHDWFQRKHDLGGVVGAVIGLLISKILAFSIKMF
jgi:hypothetical protein